MKRILSITGILTLAVLFMSAISINYYPQDPPQKKKKKHIKMVKVDEDGKKMELDTVIDADEVFVWNGDTIGDGKELKWIGEGDFDFDSDGEGNVFVMKSGDKTAPAIYEFKSDGDSVKKYKIKIASDGEFDEDVMFWNDKDHNQMMFNAPHAPKVVRIKKQKSGNVIDLSDPGIISFDKKELKDGREKITIIRNKPSEEDVELEEEIIMQGAGSHPMIIHDGHPQKTERVMIMKKDGGEIEVIEDGAVWDIKEGDTDVKVIEKDGKKITIKKIREGDEVKVDVEVEEKKDGEQIEENKENN